jgi:hypothetical protein
MTSQIPAQPAPFAPIHPLKVTTPNPRTVRAQDLTWFNTRAGEIIRTNYDTCTGQMSGNKSPWNRPPVPPNQPFWTCPYPRFDMYGLAATCPCELNRCGCSKCYQKKRCALYGGSYVDSN